MGIENKVMHTAFEDVQNYMQHEVGNSREVIDNAGGYGYSIGESNYGGIPTSSDSPEGLASSSQLEMAYSAAIAELYLSEYFPLFPVSSFLLLPVIAWSQNVNVNNLYKYNYTVHNKMSLLVLQISMKQNCMMSCLRQTQHSVRIIHKPITQQVQSR